MPSSAYRFRCLTGSALKYIAIIAMAVDHFAASILYYGVLLPAVPISRGTPVWAWYRIYKVMRFIGRIAFPIFCFLLVEGFLHTSSKKKYAFRLFIFCLLSEVPFDLALFGSLTDWSGQNVFFTLFIGFLVIWGMQKADSLKNPLPLDIIIVAAGSLAAWILKTDYDYKGIILIAIFYFFHNDRILRTVAGCLSLLWEAPACLAFIPISLYNGKRGASLKYFFYLFYPVHLLIYAAILHFFFS